MSKSCKHLIVWNYESVESEEDVLRIYGICDRCQRGFSATYSDPRYSVRDINSNEWQNYEMLGTEVFAD